MTHAVILFGHGSRDPQWRAPMDAVAQRLQARGITVRCAFLELQAPSLAQAAGELAGAGVSAIAVVPMFLGTGRHVREDLPGLVARLHAAHPAVTFEVRPPIGEDPRVLDFLAAIAAE